MSFYNRRPLGFSHMIDSCFRRNDNESFLFLHILLHGVACWCDAASSMLYILWNDFRCFSELTRIFACSAGDFEYLLSNSFSCLWLRECSTRKSANCSTKYSSGCTAHDGCSTFAADLLFCVRNSLANASSQRLRAAFYAFYFWHTSFYLRSCFFQISCTAFKTFYFRHFQKPNWWSLFGVFFRPSSFCLWHNVFTPLR